MQYLAQKGDFNDAEFKGIADEFSLFVDLEVPQTYQADHIMDMGGMCLVLIYTLKTVYSEPLKVCAIKSNIKVGPGVSLAVCLIYLSEH